MENEYTKLDAPLNRFMGIKKVKNKKTKRYDKYMMTPVQPVQSYERMHGGIPEGFSIGKPIAKKKVKRYSA